MKKAEKMEWVTPKLVKLGDPESMAYGELYPCGVGSAAYECGGGGSAEINIDPQ